MSEPLIAFDDVWLGYDGKPVLAGLSFAIGRGDFLGIVGPNGAGKTTILRAILGLLRPLKGTIRLDGGGRRDRFHFGYVPQRETVDERYPFALEDVVMMGRYRRLGLVRRPGRKDREEVRRALSTTGTGELVGTLFRDLSGGQRQRVLIARALAGEPDFLILDEPTSGLDLRGSAGIMDLIDRLHRERGLTTIMVSHQLNTVARWADHVGLLHKGHLDFGPRDQIFTSETLSHVYGPGVRVADLAGEFVVLPPRMRP